MAEKKSDPHWIENMHLKEGALRKEVGAKPGKDITGGELDKAEHSSSPTERRRADVAATLKNLRNDAHEMHGK